jgi:hypothetical protein
MAGVAVMITAMPEDASLPEHGNRHNTPALCRLRGRKAGKCERREPSPPRPRPRESPPLGGVPKGSQGGISRPCAVSWGEHNEHYVQ